MSPCFCAFAAEEAQESSWRLPNRLLVAVCGTCQETSRPNRTEICTSTSLQQASDMHSLPQAATLKQNILNVQQAKRDQSLSQPLKSSLRSLKLRRTLKGHFGKITALHWAPDAQVVSASQDGNVLLWNAQSGHKMASIQLKSAYVMAVGMEQTKQQLIACGGLDNLCTVYKLDGTSVVEMAAHDGFLSCCRFTSPHHMVTSSGDSTLLYWDLHRPEPVTKFAEHTADVMFFSLLPQSSNSVFCSCSVDRSLKLWDRRAGSASQLTLVEVHQSDVNAVECLPHGNGIVATASADNTLGLWDLRQSCNQLARFGTPHVQNDMEMPQDGFTSIAVSASGRLVVGGHASGTVVGYDTLQGATPALCFTNAHERSVSCVGMSPESDALMSGSWDAVLKVWA